MVPEARTYLKNKNRRNMPNAIALRPTGRSNKAAPPSEIIEPVRTPMKTLSTLLLASAIATLGCHAQVPPPASGSPLSPELARRVEIGIRQRAKLTPDDLIAVGPRQPSEIPGYDRIDVVFSSANGGDKSHAVPFLLSKDGNTIAQFNKFDISRDPKTLVSSAGRPGRGGPETAPVQIVVFDDLECPFCARMHAQLFPALLKRYGDQVRIVYRDYPIEKHPWAMRAAVDVNCVAAQSPNGYWDLIDSIHAHADDFGGPDHSLQKALDALDQLSREQAKKDKIDTALVEACIKKQDNSGIEESIKMGDALNVDATPALFINGEELDGAYPLTDVFRMVDQALVAAGQTPPAPYKDASPANAKAAN
jgi:protein-disulfide isomerase